MNLLVISLELPYPPHPGGGDRLRLYYVLKYLSNKHRITLVSPVGKNADSAVRRLGEFGISIEKSREPSPRFLLLRVLPTLFSTRPLAFGTPVLRGLRSRVLEVLEEQDYDLIYLHSWRSGAFLDIVAGKPCVLSPADATSSLFSQMSRGAISFFDRLHYRIEAPRVRAHEAKDYKRATKCIVVSPQDMEVLHHINADIDIAVVPNGVDTDYFSPMDVLSERQSVVFTGAMSWDPNVDAVLYFCREILPMVRESIPEVKFYVVGDKPSKAILDLAIDKSIVVTGFVPDIRPYLARCAVYVCPLRMSAGIKNKVLEAMAMGKPVLATQPSYDGIDVSYAEDALVASEPADFAAKLLDLLNNERLRIEIGQNARKLIEDKYSWERRALEYEQVFVQAIRDWRSLN